MSTFFGFGYNVEDFNAHIQYLLAGLYFLLKIQNEVIELYITYFNLCKNFEFSS